MTALSGRLCLRTNQFQSLYCGENNDMKKLRELCDSRVSIIGGIDSFTTIYLGDKERIEKDVNVCLDAFDGVPYILSCSCSVDRFLQLDKVKMMVDAVRGRNSLSQNRCDPN